MSSNGNNHRLDSWKEIAAYLRRDERTAIRWEKDRGLPVRRVPGGKRQAVFAFTAELDAWLTQAEPQGLKPNSLESPNGTSERAPAVDLEPQEPQPTAQSRMESPAAVADIRLRRPWIGTNVVRFGLPALGALLIVGVAIALSGHRFGRASENIPAHLAFTANSVQAFDQQNHSLWSHTYPRGLEAWPYKDDGHFYKFSFIGDYRGDGEHEALVPIVFHDSTVTPLTQVDLLSSSGEVLWSYAPALSFQFGKNIIGERWSVSDLFVSHRSQKPQIWAAFAHGTWGNTLIVNLDPVSGKATLRFVNTGAVHAMGEFHNGRDYLLAGGFNNESDSASLAIIDEARPFASSPQSPGTRHECVTCPPGRPDFYLIFPRSELMNLAGLHEEAVNQEYVTGNQIEVQVGDMVQPPVGIQMFYEIRMDQGFRPASFRFGSGYDMLHRKYEREGKLNHTLENCPERLHPKPVKMWTPAGGWIEIPIPPTRFNQ